ncbi:hypothetical protein K438DRAFT_1752540 [Mycena galopus ATCC 62051]|nr:hypothetical protein K438DRAFT_1752540 [Mycena galopus ATCC 62051]
MRPNLTFAESCFPNQFFSPGDVYIDVPSTVGIGPDSTYEERTKDAFKITIDLSGTKDSPMPSRSSSPANSDIFGDRDMSSRSSSPSSSDIFGDKEYASNSPDSTPPPPLLSESTDDDELTAYSNHEEVAMYVDDGPIPVGHDGPDLEHSFANVLSTALEPLRADPFTYSLVRSMLAGTESDGAYPDIDACYLEHFDGTCELRPHIAALFESRLRGLAALLCASYTHRTVGGLPLDWESVRMVLPIDSLDESGVHFPSAALFLGQNLSVSRFLGNRAEARLHVTDFYTVMRFGITHWLKSLLRTLYLREQSECNPVAATGMTKWELLDRVPHNAVIAGRIEAWIDRLLDDTHSFEAADMACMRLLSERKYNTLVILDYGETLSILPWFNTATNRPQRIVRRRVEAGDLSQLLAGFGY